MFFNNLIIWLHFSAIYLLFVTSSLKAAEVKLTYNWTVTLTAGSLLPLEHLSKYQISAHLVVYITDKYVFRVSAVIIILNIV